MEVVLGILLNADTEASLDKSDASQHQHIAGALRMYDAGSGHTVLSQAVVRGCDEAIPPILDAVR